jgi:hypothetical protein
MRLVQSRRVENRFHSFHASPDVIAVGDGPDLVRKVRMKEIETDDIVAGVPQDANQRFA